MTVHTHSVLHYRQDISRTEAPTLFVILGVFTDLLYTPATYVLFINSTIATVK